MVMWAISEELVGPPPDRRLRIDLMTAFWISLYITRVFWSIPCTSCIPYRALQLMVVALYSTERVRRRHWSPRSSAPSQKILETFKSFNARLYPRRTILVPSILKLFEWGPHILHTQVGVFYRVLAWRIWSISKRTVHCFFWKPA